MKRRKEETSISHLLKFPIFSQCILIFSSPSLIFLANSEVSIRKRNIKHSHSLAHFPSFRSSFFSQFSSVSQFVEDKVAFLARYLRTNQLISSFADETIQNPSSFLSSSSPNVLQEETTSTPLRQLKVIKKSIRIGLRSTLRFIRDTIFIVKCVVDYKYISCKKYSNVEEEERDWHLVHSRFSIVDVKKKFQRLQRFI